MPDPTPPSRRRRSARRDEGPADTARGAGIVAGPDTAGSAQPAPSAEPGVSHDAVIPPHPPINRMPPPRTERPPDEGGPAGPLRAMRMRRRPRRQPDPE